MGRHYFNKEGNVPMWVHIPGTPITLPGERTQYERLPGMTDWAPRDTVSRVGKGLAEKQDISEIAESEANQGLGASAIKGGAGGLLGGSMLARLVGGQAVSAPFKNVLKGGLNKSTMSGLSKIPMSAKALPLLGVGAGLASGIGGWASGRDERRNQAASVSKGLLSEQILQQHSLGQAQQGAQGKQLSKLPIESASMPSPKATVLSSAGV